MSLTISFAFLLQLEASLGYSYYQQRIPNGEIVPHPCNPNYRWDGVGHKNRYGGGERNRFGVDFQTNGHVWNRTLCEMDSDEDGLTNGQELGDPDCVWVYDPSGMKFPPSTSVGLSHPGYGPNDLDCEDTEEFSCPAIDEPETFNFTVRIPETTVPANVTTYTCMYFELPSDREYHIVANIPYIDNKAVMHHIIVYGCTGDISQDVPLNTPTKCDMGSGHPSCQNNIKGWSVGVAGGCDHPETGILVGGARGYRFASMQLHWNNPERRSDYTDSSGVTFYLTHKLRRYNAGVMMIGQNRLVIPPNEPSFVAEGGCSRRCTAAYLQAPIKITGVSNHMHYLGKSQYTELRRNGLIIASLANDTVYNYDSPVSHLYSDAITVNPGDELHTTCVFKSTSRVSTTYFGDATADEMCLSFFTFYPKENVRTSRCVKWASIDTCEIITGSIQDCNLSRLGDMTDQYIANKYASIEQKCSTTHCRKECKEFIKALKSSDPCYQGDVYKLRKENPFERLGMNNMGTTDPLFFAKVDSCDVEIALETCAPSNVIGAANANMAHFMVMFLAFVWKLLL